MKLIIEIPDHIYEHAKNMSEDSYDEWDAMRAIAKGFLYEERPHGEWLKKNTEFGGICWATCSVCKKISNGEGQDNGFGHDYFYPNFCPNCGSDMRKEGEAE